MSNCGNSVHSFARRWQHCTVQFDEPFATDSANNGRVAWE